MKRSWQGAGHVIIVIALSLAAVGIPATAMAGEQGSCEPDDPSKAKLFENIIGDEGDDDDVAWQCGAHSNLANKPHSLPGTCDDGSLGNSSWNDCVSSIKPWTPAGQQFCVFEDADYSGVHQWWNPPITGRHNVSDYLNDRISSVDFVPGGCS